MIAHSGIYPLTFTGPSVCLICSTVYAIKPGYLRMHSVSHGFCEECFSMPNLSELVDTMIDAKRRRAAEVAEFLGR